MGSGSIYYRCFTVFFGAVKFPDVFGVSLKFKNFHDSGTTYSETTQTSNLPRSTSTCTLSIDTLLGTNISPEKSILKMIFLFPRWDMLISWRVYVSPVPWKPQERDHDH